MANKKFSQFTAKTNLNDFSGLVGFESTGAPFSGSANDNYYITKANFYSDLQENLNLSNFATGILPTDRGGTGLNSTSTLLNANVNYSLDGSGILPAARGGTGVAGSGGSPPQRIWNAVQQFVWTDGSPVAWNNVPNGTDIYLPFNTTATIDVSGNTAADTNWVATNSAQAGNITEQCTFTLGDKGGGVWRIDVIYPTFNLYTAARAALAISIDGTLIPIYQRNVGTPSNQSDFIQSMSGNLTYEFSGEEEVQVWIRFDNSSSDPYPADSTPGNLWNTRPPEVTFTRII